MRPRRALHPSLPRAGAASPAGAVGGLECVASVRNRLFDGMPQSFWESLPSASMPNVPCSLGAVFTDMSDSPTTTRVGDRKTLFTLSGFLAA